tara:strand:- start:3386 stop:4222 length:837 start_codon:yes stop_codon:yes gene_type:complete
MVVIKPKRDFTSLNRVSYASSNTPKKAEAAVTIAQYKHNICTNLGIGIGPRHHEECPFSSVNDHYAATGSEALKATIAAAYKQVFGNLGPTESQRCTELESQLCNGDINVRDFVAGLAKSDLYKQNYFSKVSPIRGVELNLKHLLGRPPVNQAEVSACISLIAEQGFDALVDKLTQSGEYLEVFGTDTVPYPRAFKSEAGFYCSTFVNMGEVCTGNAASDTTVQSRSLLVMALNNARSLSTAGGSFDVSAFVYSKAIKDPNSGAFQRMFQPKTAKTWG